MYLLFTTQQQNFLTAAYNFGGKTGSGAQESFYMSVLPTTQTQTH